MTAGVGEDGGLHTAPLVPQATAEALPDALVMSSPTAADVSAGPDSSAPDSSAPEATAADVAVFSIESTAEAAESSQSSVTQALPLVRRDGTGEPPSVRAVARQSPALPALGRDEIIDAPHSARITADRRRRAGRRVSRGRFPRDQLRPGRFLSGRRRSCGIRRSCGRPGRRFGRVDRRTGGAVG